MLMILSLKFMRQYVVLILWKLSISLSYSLFGVYLVCVTYILIFLYHFQQKNFFFGNLLLLYYVVSAITKKELFIPEKEKKNQHCIMKNFVFSWKKTKIKTWTRGENVCFCSTLFSDDIYFEMVDMRKIKTLSDFISSCRINCNIL